MTGILNDTLSSSQSSPVTSASGLQVHEVTAETVSPLHPLQHHGVILQSQYAYIKTGQLHSTSGCQYFFHIDFFFYLVLHSESVWVQTHNTDTSPPLTNCLKVITYAQGLIACLWKDFVSYVE